MSTDPRLVETPPERLHRLARQVRRLCPERADPERFLVAKEEIAAELRRLAREVRHG